MRKELTFLLPKLKVYPVKTGDKTVNFCREHDYPANSRILVLFENQKVRTDFFLFGLLNFFINLYVFHFDTFQLQQFVHQIHPPSYHVR